MAKKTYVVEELALPERVSREGKAVFVVVEKRIVARTDNKEDADAVTVAMNEMVKAVEKTEAKSAAS